MQFELLVNSTGLLGLIPVFIMVILTLWGVFTRTGRQRILSLLGFLTFVCVAGAQLFIQLTRLGFIYLFIWTNLGVYVDFGLKGAYIFLIVIYAIILAFPDFFNARKWIVIVPLIGLIVYEILMYYALAVSFVLYGSAWLVTALALVVLFMIVIPLYGTFQYTRQDRIRGSPKVKWMWIVTLGGLVWAGALMALFGGWYLGLDLSFFSSLSATLVSLLTIGWYMILVGYFFQLRTS
ncbi:MAG: hypothetical protein ACXADB_09290 [Candidatus Hermodarchaeia archaeon]